jgi:hypothetical protein
MHALGITRSVVDITSEQARGACVRRFTIEFGEQWRSTGTLPPRCTHAGACPPATRPAERFDRHVESVGNLVCPALFDLGEDAKVVILSVT